MDLRRDFFLLSIILTRVVLAQPSTQPADGRLRMTFVYAKSCDACASTEHALNALVEAHAMGAVELERIDADAHRAAVAAMQVTTTPTLRVTDLDGRLLASASGPSDEQAIRALLATAAERARANGATQAPDDLSAAIAGIESDDRDARDRAIDWLATHDRPEIDRVVIDRFANGTLRVRLVLLEVLRRWSAPTADLDPWRPETIGTARVEALRDWARTHERTSTQPSTLPVSE